MSQVGGYACNCYLRVPNRFPVEVCYKYPQPHMKASGLGECLHKNHHNDRYYDDWIAMTTLLELLIGTHDST